MTNRTHTFRLDGLRLFKLLLALIGALFLLFSVSADAQIRHGLRDDQGRHYIPRGFVVNTNDGNQSVMFEADDYWRMARMGANMQVIRLELSRFGTMPGTQYDASYFDKLDTLTRLGSNVGMLTTFKMTLYGVPDFTWEAFWANENGIQDDYAAAWHILWERYADNSDVVGYDLVNEPRKMTMDISYDALTRDHLVPYYERLIGEALAYNPDKMFLCQTIFMNRGEAIDFNQYAEIRYPIDGPNVVFAPHIYQDRIDRIEPTLRRFEREALLLDAPILIGEWGFPTLQTTDTSVEEQLEYQRFYIRTAELFDETGMGTIKAWFLGTPRFQNFLPGGPSTWAIFQDSQSRGTVERRYITDIIARPYPRIVAGDIQRFGFDFATRELSMTITPNNSAGASLIFAGADRHYPDGFSLHVGENLVLAHQPGSDRSFEVVRDDPSINPSDIFWDESAQQIVVLRWPETSGDLDVRVTPGIWRDLPPPMIPPRRNGD